MITYKAIINLQIVSHGSVNALATWTRREKIKEADGKKIEPTRRFFRIGTASVRIIDFTEASFCFILFCYISLKEKAMILDVFLNNDIISTSIKFCKSVKLICESNILI